MFQKMQKLWEAAKLGQGNLPTGLDIFAHYLYLRTEKCEKGEWNKNISLFEAAKVVTSDVISQWNKTNIPHILHGKNGIKT